MPVYHHHISNSNQLSSCLKPVACHTVTTNPDQRSFSIFLVAFICWKGTARSQLHKIWDVTGMLCRKHIEFLENYTVNKYKLFWKHSRNETYRINLSTAPRSQLWTNQIVNKALCSTLSTRAQNQREQINSEKQELLKTKFIGKALGQFSLGEGDWDNKQTS